MIRWLRIALAAFVWWLTYLFCNRVIGWSESTATMYVICAIGGYATVALNDSRKGGGA